MIVHPKEFFGPNVLRQLQLKVPLGKQIYTNSLGEGGLISLESNRIGFFMTGDCCIVWERE